MPRTFLARVWKAVKPPPPVPARRRLNRAQRRLIRVTSIILALGAGTWAVYAYIEAAPDRASSHYRRGMRLLGPGEFQGAITEFTKAIDIVPEYADAYLGRGKARQAAGQTDAALADFDKAIVINPISDLAYTSRGIVQRSRGDSHKALEDFTYSIHLHPTSDAYYQRGLTYQGLDQPARALPDYDAAISYDPGAPVIYLARARTKRDLGDFAGARKDQQTAEDLQRK